MHGQPGGLVDRFGRVVRDLRVSVTPRCNFRCHYCDPLGAGGHEPPGTLGVEQVGTVLRAAAALGMSSVRFTGGEPLLRKELPAMIRIAKGELELPDVAVTTNASALERRLPELLDAGLDRLNISLDALDPEVFRAITQGGDFARVWRGIEAATDAGLTPVKLNTVVMRGLNDGEIVPLARLAEEGELHVRFIEYMHLNNAAVADYRVRFMAGADIRARIEAAFGALEPVETDPSAPARLFRVPGWRGAIGFINPVTEPFCGACSRMRVTSDGMLRPCLLTDREFELRSALAEADPVAAVIDRFLLGAGRKVASGITAPTERPRTMVAIGG
ncbi:MAG TPA: GTP 3',8-cyclase MoaA [Trueperaceae bacterium]|nr:GTP 3',8-cyclase MoaA [Trueperaceae bacterium]